MKKRKVVQFKMRVWGGGGGERVMESMAKALGATLIAISSGYKKKRLVKEVGDLLDQRLAHLGQALTK